MPSRLRLSLPVVTALAFAGCAHAPRPGMVLTIVGTAAALTGVVMATGGSECQEEPHPSCDETSTNAKVGWPIAGVGAAALVAGVVWMATDTSGPSSASRGAGRESLLGAAREPEGSTSRLNARMFR